MHFKCFHCTSSHVLFQAFVLLNRHPLHFVLLHVHRRKTQGSLCGCPVSPLWVATSWHTPMLCVCGERFSVQHAFSCPCGGFPSIRHNELRDVTANLLTEVCHDVMVEPYLQPLTGKVMANATSNSSEGARLDIAVNGFWGGRFEKTFLDVRVFNPHAQSNNSIISNCYRKHENEKKRAYEQRIRDVEHSSFSPLVFSATGGMAKQCTTFYKRLASLLAEKWDQHNSTTLFWLRCRLYFSLLMSAIRCIHGARSSHGHSIRSSSVIDLISNEAQLSL